MVHRNRRSFKALVYTQAGLVFGGILLAASAPPAKGTILLLPVSGAAAGPALNAAISHGLRLVSVGPVAGSLIVYGSSSGLAATMWTAGFVMLAAPPGTCGAASDAA